MKKILAVVIALFVNISPALAAININTATQAELMTLNGIGPMKATMILDYRAKYGVFKTMADLKNLPGLGENTIKAMGSNAVLTGKSTTVVESLPTSVVATPQPDCVESSSPILLTTTQGAALQVGIPNNSPPPPLRLDDIWYSISIVGANLVVDASRETRRPDWNLVTHRSAPSTPGDPDNTSALPATQHALNMPSAALLAFRVGHFDCKHTAAGYKPGKYPSLLTGPALLHDRWKSTFQLQKQTWTVFTESERRKDGALLAGSMALFATANTGERHELLPGANGMAFERQELLWLGSLRGESGFDFLLKRTWITGEIEHVLKIGSKLAYTMVDLDFPLELFSSGIEEWQSTNTHISQRRSLPSGKFGQAAFSISEESWNAALSAAAGTALPKLLFDRRLMLNAEGVRFTMEYLPRKQGTAPGSASDFRWGGPVVVKAHFRGKSQVILQTSELDGSSFRVQVGIVNGEPNIQISYFPHYNNGFEHYWVWDEAKGRFLRLYKAQSQGC